MFYLFVRYELFSYKFQVYNIIGIAPFGHFAYQRKQIPNAFWDLAAYWSQ